VIDFLATIYPPMLMEPVLLVVALVAIFLWLYCAQRTDRRLKPPEEAKPWVNLAVLVGGPIVWILIHVIRKILQTESRLPGPLFKLAYWLGVQKGLPGRQGPEPTVELLRSNGRPLSLRKGKGGQQVEAMETARRIIHRALLLRAADILLDPKPESTYQIRFRVDGLLRKPEWLDPELALGVVNCFKILSDMDIAERRRPQDGSFIARKAEREYNLRTATSGTVYGEKMAIRVLNSTADLLTLQQLGLPQDYMQRVHAFLKRSHGMMIVCGATGSGKTTTLYAALAALAEGGRNLITIEDPVEYTLPFASQTGINPKADITFATQLRHVLRQAPDVILVGEIRDADTARIALQASETGHLVFSTLHANDAVSGLIRLVDLGIEPYLVGSGLNCLLSQRLVRVLCPACAQPAHISPRLAGAASNRNIDLENVRQPVGCAECDDTGYRGRMGIFQMMDVSKEISSMLMKRPALVELMAMAKTQGLTTLRQRGMALVLNGKTSMDEVLRVTVE